MLVRLVNTPANTIHSLVKAKLFINRKGNNFSYLTFRLSISIIEQKEMKKSIKANCKHIRNPDSCNLVPLDLSRDTSHT